MTASRSASTQRRPGRNPRPDRRDRTSNSPLRLAETPSGPNGSTAHSTTSASSTAPSPPPRSKPTWQPRSPPAQPPRRRRPTPRPQPHPPTSKPPAQPKPHSRSPGTPPPTTPPSAATAATKTPPCSQAPPPPATPTPVLPVARVTRLRWMPMTRRVTAPGRRRDEFDQRLCSGWRYDSADSTDQPDTDKCDHHQPRTQLERLHRQHRRHRLRPLPKHQPDRQHHRHQPHLHRPCLRQQLHIRHRRLRRRGNRSNKATLTAATSPCPPPSDKAPSVAGNLRGTGTTQTSSSVAWDASTDNVAVTGYRRYNGGSLVSSALGTVFTFSGLSCGTNYGLAVDAFDAAGNRSAKASMSATTAACTPPPPPPCGSCGELVSVAEWF